MPSTRRATPVNRLLGPEIAFQFFGRRRVGLTDRP